MAQHGHSSAFFVGSPDALPTTPEQDRPSTSSRPLPSFSGRASNSSLPRNGSGNIASTPLNGRPSLDRSATSPSGQFGRQSLRKTLSHKPQDREWTLFGQLMENEGQLRPSNTTPKLRRRNAQHGPSSSPEHTNTDGDPSLLPSYSSSRLSALSAEPESIADDPVPLLQDSQDYDSDDSDHSYDEQSSPQEPVSHHRFKWLRLPTLSRLQKNVLKCAIAYLIASLFTFVPYLSGFLSDVTSSGKWEGPSPSGHLVCSVSVYFNPAKTLGAMVEADIYVIFGLAFVSLVSLASMGMFWFFEVRPGWEWLADLLVLVWIAAAMACVAWLKVWMARPSFNTACSMIVISLFIVLIKEGGLETLLQVAFIVIVGAVVSNFVCLTLWTQSATSNLQDDMITALDSFSTLLQMLTRTFMLDPDFHPKQSKLLRAVEAHQKSFTSLKRNLTEAHSEWLCSPTRMGSNSTPYEDAVDSLNRLAQHLGGLRSGTRLQADLTKAHREGKLLLQHGAGNAKLFVPADTSNKESKSAASGPGTARGKLPTEDEEAAMLAAAATMFGDLVEELGAPMNSLANACILTLQRMQNVFERHRQGQPIDVHEFYQLSEDVERTLYNFESTSNYTVMRLYRRSDMTDRFSMVSDDGIPSVLADGDNETVFLVYFFIFTLQEFARELVSCVDAMGRIYALERRVADRSGVWQWLKDRCACLGVRTRGASEQRSRPLKRRLSTLVPTEGEGRKAANFPKVRPHAPNTVQTPSRSSLSFVGRVQQTFWAWGARLKESDLLYALKVGVATAILASPAFFDTTRGVFVEYRGEWAIISFFSVMSPTIGATNFLSLHRVLGTLFGAATATVSYTLFHNQPIVLALFGFLYTIPCFYYLLLMPEYATSARFVLLTYNLTCLYCYNVRFENLSVVDIAYHRAVAVIVGVLWAFVVSRFWWPAEARRELGKQLSEFCLNIGWLYTRLVVNYSSPPEALMNVEPLIEITPPTPLPHAHGPGRSALPDRASEQLTSSIHDFLAMELHLQLNLIKLQGLLAQTQHEPRLKGPFPVKLYRSILTSLQTILDKMHSMRCVTTREEWYTSVRRDFILPVAKERREMVGNVILYFSTLSSAFRLKAPLPPYLPPAEKSRTELVRAIRNLEVVKMRNVKGSRQLLYFAYALMMKGVVQELDFLGKTLQEAFGVLGGNTQDFENLFRAEAIDIEEAG